MINPLISAIVHKPDFSYLVLDVNGGKMKYGNFLNAIINFLIVSAAVYFFAVLPINALMKRLHPAKPAAPTTRPCPECLSDIPLGAKRCSHCGQPVMATA